MLFTAIALLIGVQFTELVLASGLFAHGNSVRYFWIFSSLTTLAVGVLVLGTQLLLSDETARSEAIAEYLNDGLIFMEGDHAAYANPLARELLGQKELPVVLSAEICLVLEQAHNSHTPVLYDATIEGRRRHFLVSKVQLPCKPSTDLERRMFVFQDVTFIRENEEAKVNFIGALSHEIRTPVTSLTMALAMLERTGYDPELVRIASSDVGRLRVLLEDLLNASKLKIVRNPNALHMRDTNLTALIHQSIKIAAPLAEAKGVQLISKGKPGPGQIMASIDATKITWVLSTLLTDAIRQTPPTQSVVFSSRLDSGVATFEISYQRRLDSLGPTGHAIVGDIIQGHAGRFTSIHKANHESIFKISIHAYLHAANNTKGIA
ncbi:MAG: hypothetical protein HY074_09170 [Deltaproteobacteria bacterium]|nr:hypothetical protein [Deltaproteobacteria bacterium]